MRVLMYAVTATVSTRVFLADNIVVTDATRSPVKLGVFPHQCVGNVTQCPNGFTWVLWYKPLAPNRQVMFKQTRV